ncbi:hypothetical protein FHR38_003173 [Micromonospora polyrhachis]|uniref:Uncharacterized protein n=1 Tax=Micromonospora polyrhachis TaxID=1282883 RepID=A0A7W7SR57_9ACTN|nr:hypothetical protein [Micromonospora polyrhachis]
MSITVPDLPRGWVGPDQPRTVIHLSVGDDR